MVTLVLVVALAPCGHGQQDFSPTPQLSQDGTLLPLSPGGRSIVWWSVFAWLYFYICLYTACVCYGVLTVNSPDLVKGHQPRALFCWKMEILSVPSVSMSALHNLAVLAPRVNPWRSNSSVPADTQSVRCTAVFYAANTRISESLLSSCFCLHSSHAHFISIIHPDSPVRLLILFAIKDCLRRFVMSSCFFCFQCFKHLAPSSGFGGNC